MGDVMFSKTRAFSLSQRLMQFFNVPLFCFRKIASAGPSHLTPEEVCQSVCYSSRFTHRMCDFSQCFSSKIVVVVGEVGRSSSFCKHTTSVRRVPYSVSPILAQSQSAQLGHNTMIGVIVL